MTERWLQRSVLGLSILLFVALCLYRHFRLKPLECPHGSAYINIETFNRNGHAWADSDPVIQVYPVDSVNWIIRMPMRKLNRSGYYGACIYQEDITKDSTYVIRAEATMDDIVQIDQIGFIRYGQFTHR